ncbi:MAG: hypothetical protein FIA95_05645 [Gemmatimonadetes bacterium]|nr:hypothetical protein [Gemmatimonadota bacterium]
MGALAEWLGGVLAPWSDLFSSSSPLETAVMFLHLGGVMAAGGMAFTLDRAVLRTGRGTGAGRGDLARELHASHGAVIGGLAVVLASGIALTAADPTVFLVSWLFWAKMAVVVVLLGNGWLLKKAGEDLLVTPDDPVAFGRLRASALRSGALWALALLLGVALTVYA